MLKPTRAEVAAQAGNLVSDLLSTEDQMDARTVIRQHPAYTSANYPDLEDRLAAVTGYEAQQILAALAKIDALGQKHSSVDIEGLVRRKKDTERVDWVLFIINVLWDGLEPTESMASGDVTAPSCSPFCSCCGYVACCCVGVV